MAEVTRKILDDFDSKDLLLWFNSDWTEMTRAHHWLFLLWPYPSLWKDEKCVAGVSILQLHSVNCICSICGFILLLSYASCTSQSWWFRLSRRNLYSVLLHLGVSFFAGKGFFLINSLKMRLYELLFVPRNYWKSEKFWLFIFRLFFCCE